MVESSSEREVLLTGLQASISSFTRLASIFVHCLGGELVSSSIIEAKTPCNRTIGVSCIWTKVSRMGIQLKPNTLSYRDVVEVGRGEDPGRNYIDIFPWRRLSELLCSLTITLSNS